MSLTECQDPTLYFSAFGPTGDLLKYPTNSSYPPGTVCAREKNLKFCPTSGESGSPLMVEDEEGRFAALGLNSFIKGCSTFTYRSAAVQQGNYLRQFSENPTVYSRLICYLSWIAEQYGMTYSPTGEEDERCKVGTGDIKEVGGGDCRTTPTNDGDRTDGIEAECIFPYHLDGKEYNQCTLSEVTGFSRPVFRCPIRTIRGRGTNYTTEDMDREYCPTNFIENGLYPVNNTYNGEFELDPANRQRCFRDSFPYWNGRPAFATCKNTCPGGETETPHINSL